MLLPVAPAAPGWPRRLRAALRPLAAAALVAAAVGCGGAAAPDASGPVEVRLAYMPNLTHAIGLVAVAEGTVERALAPHTVTVKAFSAGPAIVEALLAGEIDIAYLGPSPAVNGFVKSRGTALRNIAGASSGGAQFVIRSDASADSPADLAGKRIATPQRGGTQDVALRYLARSSGLRTSDEGGTVTVVPMAPADILAAFRTGQIDGAWMAEPWTTRLVQEAGARVWFDERDRWPGGRFATTHVVVSTVFLERHPELVTSFLRAHVEAARFVAERPTEARDIANAEIRRITSAAIPQAVLEAAFANIDFTTDPLRESVEEMARYAFELGFLGDTAPDLSTYFATGPLEAVLREQGQPAPQPAGGTP